MRELFQQGQKGFTSTQKAGGPEIPDTLWIKCQHCRELIYQKQIRDNLNVCPKCGYHRRLDAYEWLQVLTNGEFTEYDEELCPVDPLNFTGPDGATYASRLGHAQQRVGTPDALISGIGRILGYECIITVCNFAFMASSMGSVYGEKLARAAERARQLKLPLLTINCSGGARMQEGLISLMQMPKICMALSRLAAVKCPHLSLLIDPCFGGVLASYASVADIIIAETGANIGFAGKRVIDQTIRGNMPSKQQTAEVLLHHGMIDIVASRHELRSVIGQLLTLWSGVQPIMDEPPTIVEHDQKNVSAHAASHTSVTAWDRVRLARHPLRPHTLDYIRYMCQGFVELHGDRRFSDDPAIVGGIASFEGQTVVVIGHQKGSNTRENIQRHFGMSKPEGYRKALRLLHLADKFGFPVFCFIDTPGADPEKESEERGQALAIAESIMAMTTLRTPIIACVIGEGNSGGAIGIGVADRVLMLENSIYMVISPEGCASILWRDASRASEAANAMRITAKDAFDLGIIDQIINEPNDGAHTDGHTTIGMVRTAFRTHLQDLQQIDVDDLLEQRYTKYRSIGYFHERFFTEEEDPVACIQESQAKVVQLMAIQNPRRL